ncbi:hypothetical protein QBC33DRAFT_59192 [Phialemonium atrogriseum]|uniref:JmjC domain-containing protein n=1 Tax=Phialemonium atrogriseum TaxID=1093897 RepID=A0AAJ0C099_9PEZI|nr:uncharacterized protein QBC33DRAFT_59192 [Phialemonium atrogriseum]KAK1767798.1 hypothetical protein QBC33DRAFT_59192 [Phialemonium atrogriseum]
MPLISRACLLSTQRPALWRATGFKNLSTITAIPKAADTVGCEEFRREAFSIDRPLVMRGSAQHDRPDHSTASVFSILPKWFRLNQETHHYDATPYLQNFSATLFPYELVQGPKATSASENTHEGIYNFSIWLSSTDKPIHKHLTQLLQHHLDTLSPNGQEVQLLRFYAPLALLLAALEYNVSHSQDKVTQLYIAQAPLSDLPAELASDMRSPEIVQSAGKGDIYNSSIWLGLEPTYTPWHRDPNPNLFCQLCSSKVTRLLPPSAGERIFRDVQMRLGRSGSSQIRGEEMMQGPERLLLHDAIWGEEATADIQEARLDAGDALYIPKGWWHSVKSGFRDGRLNGSVNWWFR